MSEIILNLIRNGMLWLSGILSSGVLKPYIGTVITDDEWATFVNAFVSGALVVISVAWKIIQKRKYAKAEAAKIKAVRAEPK